MHTLKTGDKAPGFSLIDSEQKTVVLQSYRNQWLVLFFYPKDDTPGCTVEACQFKQNYADMLAMNVRLLGINTDKPDSHHRFISKFQLPFPLLSDHQGEISKLYGSLFKLGPVKFCKRHSFIIDPNGKIAKIYRKVDPKNHSQQIITDLKALKKD
ncbi:MAG: peroxiredoxin [Methylococcales symbiont of Iophon sp. n. MRB-2018]|nr:MAG: peroxiredoxin [Methylococcales symbiont of Iophon sp. n. MRB-2018]KAF3980244.1 MAG: peroxiredoxin [Methylococcales symbiont of Iophon sp. n. MRB-2018]